MYNCGKVATFMENSEATRASAFYLVSEVSPIRHPGWPLDSISVNKATGIRFTDEDRGRYSLNKTGMQLDYRRRCVDFLTAALGVQR